MSGLPRTGRTWREVVATAAFGERAYLDMAVHNGSMYVYGGARYSIGGAFQGFADAFVWRSSDGGELGCGGHDGRDAAGGQAGFVRGELVDCWWDRNLRQHRSKRAVCRGLAVGGWGRNWELATADAGFSGRAWHQVVSVGGGCGWFSAAADDGFFGWAVFAVCECGGGDGADGGGDGGDFWGGGDL